jgi:methyl-accepting chemotaxis protein
MATKSVIEIDVLDEKFQAFVKEFDKLKKSLDNMPKGWDKASSSGTKSTQAVNKNIQDVKKSTDGVNKSLQESKNKQDNFNKSIRDGGKALSLLASTTASIAKNMAGSVVSLAKFVTLGALGGGFGLAKLGESTGDERRQAQGLGISRGQLLTATTYGKPYIDTEKVLANLADILNDQTRLIELKQVGIEDPRGKNAFDVLADTLEGALEQFIKFQGQIQPLEQLGILKLVDYETLRRLSILPEAERKTFFGKIRKEDPILATQDKNDAAFQNFIVNLKKASKTVEIALVNGLEKLPDPLGRLSNAIAEAIKVFLESPRLGEFIDFAIKKIQEFGEYLASDKFKKNIESFLKGIEDAADAVAGFAKWISSFFPSTAELDRREKEYKEKKEEEARQPAKPFSFRRFQELFKEPVKPVDSNNIQKQGTTKEQRFFEALEVAKKDYREMTGKELPITSLSRTREQQQDLYDRYMAGEKGIYKPLNPADFPNQKMFHENQVDIGISKVPKGFDLKTFMELQGFSGGSKSDPVHYNFVDPLANLEKRMKQGKTEVIINNRTGNSISTTTNQLQTQQGPN